MNTLRNSTSYGADILHYASLKGEQDSGPLFFAVAHAATLRELADKVAYAVSKEEKVRPIILDHWKSSPEGDEVQKEYASLLGIKQKTPDQTVRQQTLLELFNQVNIQTLRNIETLVGIDKLSAWERDVNIQRIPGTSKYACYVISTQQNDDGTRKEFIHVPFTATQLRKLGKVQLDVATVDTISTADIRKACDSLKQGAPNAQAGGTEAIARTALGKTAKALETAIAGTFDASGKLDGVSAATRKDVYMLWASMDAQMSEAEKAKARKAYAELNAKQAA